MALLLAWNMHSYTNEADEILSSCLLNVVLVVVRLEMDRAAAYACSCARGQIYGHLDHP